MGIKRGEGKETGNGGQESGREEKQPIYSRTERKDEQSNGLYLDTTREILEPRPGPSAEALPPVPTHYYGYGLGLVALGNKWLDRLMTTGT